METQNSSLILLKSWRRKAFLAMALFLIPAISALATDYSTSQSSGSRTITLTTHPSNSSHFRVDGAGDYTNLNTINVTGGTLTIKFDTDNSVIFNGTITVSRGTLILKKIRNSSASTLKRASGYTGVCITVQNSSSTYTDCNLRIIGIGTNDEERFVIDGSNNFTITPNGDSYVAISSGVLSTASLVWTKGGNLEFSYVDLSRNWNNNVGGVMEICDGEYSKSNVNMSNCRIHSCYAFLVGAALYIHDSKKESILTMDSCQIYDCFNDKGVTGDHGGVIRTLTSSRCSMEMTDCEMSSNYCSRNSIIMFNSPRSSLSINRVNFHHNWCATGGCLKIACHTTIEASHIHHNTCQNGFGAIFYVTPGTNDELGDIGWQDGTLTLDDQTVLEYNTVENGNGGVLCITLSPIWAGSTYYQNNANGDLLSYSLNINGTTIRNNTAGGNGGAIYITRAPDSEWSSHGLVPYNTDLNINYGNIYNNTASGNGGAICATNIPVFIGDGINELNIMNNTAGNGGGIYVDGGAVNIRSGNIGLEKFSYTDYEGTIYTDVAGGNLANGGNGGGLYVTGGSITMTNGHIQYNQATVSGSTGGNGGGMYVNSTINFSNGVISNNTANGNSASAGGGGIYISSTGSLNLSGTATVTGNSVPTANGQGGGIYLAGAMTANGDALNVTNNTAGTAKAMNANNVYLPGTYTVDLGNHTYTEATTHRTIEVLGDLDPTKVNLGITTEQIAQQYTTDSDGLPVYFDIPVLTATAANRGKLQDIYDALIEGISRIRDDRLEHKPKYTTGETILYFTKFQYDYPNFMEETFTNPINTKKKLYQYMCYVNGVNGYASPHPDQDGILTIDIDASDWYRWIPIGCKESETDPDVIFTGNFICKTADQSEEAVHVVRGLQMVADREIYGDFGMFGMTQGATIKGIVSSGSFVYKEDAGAIGCLVGSMDGGTLERCGGSGKLVAAHSGCVAGGLVGKATNPVTIKDCFGTADITGYTMGGLVGTLCAGSSAWNSYTYGRYTRQSGSTDFVGGLAGINAGTFENCFSHTFDTAPTGSFGHFAGQNNAGGAFSYCYAPNGNYISEDNSTAPGHLLGHGTFGSSNLLNGKYGYAHSGQAVTIETGETNGYVRNGADGAGGPLTVATTNDESGYGRSLLYGMLPTLNAYVSDQNTNHGGSYTSWMRTMASPINADMPIHKFGGPICAATPDGHGMDYATDLNNLIWTYNPDNHSGYTATAGSIFLYGAPGTITQSTSASMRLYIPEDLGIVQAAGITTHARVGVTFDNSDASNLGGKPYDWHMFSTALQAAPLGLTNSDEATHYYGYVVPDGALSLSADGYFPTNTPFTSMDFYCYSEPDFHWINFKRHSNDHWHEDEPHDQIFYTNETNLVQGKGYLLAIDQPTMLMADGVLTNAEVPCDVTATNRARKVKGINLIGNPYQSYLDFDAFAEETANSGVGVYYILDADAQGYLAYTAGATPQPSVPGTMGVASRYIHPHQGFFVKVDADRQLKFTTAMRAATGEGSTFRDGTPRYPLVNLVCTDSQGCNDFATVELDRPEKGGGEKIMELHSGNASIWFHLDDSNWHVAFTTAGITEAPVRFKAYEDGVFTLRWNTQNADFSYLHLIDNLTGADIDMLAAEQYAFEGRTDDYLSRFKLVFGIDEPEVPEPVEGPTTFAFMMGDELVVNGKGTLQMFDVNGRCLMERTVCGTQTAIAMPKVSAGVYVLQLTDSSQTKVQKLIIR